jgi:hypothetical protein
MPIVELVARFINESYLIVWGFLFFVGSLAEAAFSADRSQPWGEWLLNVRYSLIYCTTIFVLSPSIFLCVTALAGKLGLGLIDFTAFIGSGVAYQLMAAALLYLITNSFNKAAISSSPSCPPSKASLLNVYLSS